jgi:hypothetical protein
MPALTVPTLGHPVTTSTLILAADNAETRAYAHRIREVMTGYTNSPVPDWAARHRARG